METKAKIKKLIYRSPDTGFSVLSLSTGDGKVFTATCVYPIALVEGQEINIVQSKWVQSKYGEQLEIKSFYLPEPNTTEEIKAYLSSGAICGIGDVLANRIVGHFGEKAIEILDKTPERLLEVRGIGEESLKRIVSSWKEARLVSKVLISLCGLGLSLTFAQKAYDYYGADAVEVIRENPYKLTAISGIGFLRADKIAQTLGFPLDGFFRLSAGILHTLRSALSTGHCYLPQDELIIQAQNILSISDATLLFNVLTELTKSGELIEDEGLYYIPCAYLAERYVEKRLLELASRRPTHFYSNSFCESPVFSDEVLGREGFVFSLTDGQKDAIKVALNSGLSVITGLPGTGKTTCIKFIVSLLKEMGLSFALCAPTGKAAKRLSEVTSEPAETIHRLLEYSSQEGFKRNEENPLDVDYLIVDEASMVDIFLMAQLLKAVSDTTSVILVGDVNQLPSVGPGNVLKDVMTRRVCRVNSLTEIHRQVADSMIIRFSHLVVRGIKPILVRDMGDIVFLEEEPLGARNAILGVLEKTGFSLKDIQVLCPIKKGLLGVIELNKFLQFTLNKNTQELKGFKLSDRVIHTVNNYKKGVFNGEVGYITEINSDFRELTVDFGDKVILYKEHELDELELAYALTVHKAQGSQFPCVILILYTHHYIMLRRQLLYTAISRAEKLLVIVGQDKAFAIAVKNNQEQKRYTNLFWNVTTTENWLYGANSYHKEVARL